MIITPILVGVALINLVYRLVPLLQIDRETPRDWVEEHAVYWAMKNGFFLGIGFTSRVGFWLWYIVPLSTLLIGDIRLGGMIYGVYGASRGSAVWLILLKISRANEVTWLTDYYQSAQHMSNWLLLTVGLAVIVLVG